MHKVNDGCFRLVTSHFHLLYLCLFFQLFKGHVEWIDPLKLLKLPGGFLRNHLETIYSILWLQVYDISNYLWKWTGICVLLESLTHYISGLFSPGFSNRQTVLFLCTFARGQPAVIVFVLIAVCPVTPLRFYLAYLSIFLPTCSLQMGH